VKFNKSIIKSLVLIFSLIVVLGSQAKIYEGIKEPAPGAFDVCIFLEEGSEVFKTYKDKTMQAAIRTLIKIVEQKEAVIASDLLINLLVSIANNREVAMLSGGSVKIFPEKDQDRVKETLNSIIKECFIYKTKNNEFVVLIPKKKYVDVAEKAQLDLEKLGLNEKELALIPGVRFDMEFMGIEPSVIKVEDGYLSLKVLKKGLKKDKYKIKIDVLNSIFSDSQGKKIEKRVLLMGHGQFKKRIVHLEFGDFLKFVRRLEEVNCVFLYIISCFVAGINQVRAQRQLKEDLGRSIKKWLPSFIMIAGSLTDASAYYGKMKVDSFFEDLHTFLDKEEWETQWGKIQLGVKGERVRDWIKARQWVSKKPFQKIVKNIAGNLIENTPSIYIPYASNEYGLFDVLEVDEKVKVITLPVLMQCELEVLFSLDAEIAEIRAKIVKMKGAGPDFQEMRKKFLELVGKKQKQEILRRKLFPKLFSLNAKIREIKIKIRDMKKRLGFAPVDLRKDLANTLLKKSKIEKKLKRAEIIVDPKIVLGSKVEYILVYPSIINIPIEVQFDGVVKVISIVPGNSQHYIKKIENKKGSFEFGYEGQKSKKVFFVRKKKWKYGKNKNLMEFREGKYREYMYREGFSGGYSCGAGKSSMSKEEAGRKIDEIIRITSPAKEVRARGVLSGEQFKKIIDYYIKGKRGKKIKLPTKVKAEDIKKAEEILANVISEAGQKIDKFADLDFDKKIEELESFVEKLGESIVLMNRKAAKYSKFFKEYSVPYLVEFLKNIIKYTKEFIGVLHILEKKDMSLESFENLVEKLANRERFKRYVDRGVNKIKEKQSKGFNVVRIVLSLLTKLQEDDKRVFEKNKLRIIEMAEPDILEQIRKIIKAQGEFYRDVSRISQSGEFLFQKIRKLYVENEERLGAESILLFLSALPPNMQSLIKEFSIGIAEQYIKSLIGILYQLLVKQESGSMLCKEAQGVKENQGFKIARENYEKIRAGLKQDHRELYEFIEFAIGIIGENIILILKKVCPYLGKKKLQEMENFLTSKDNKSEINEVVESDVLKRINKIIKEQEYFYKNLQELPNGSFQEIKKYLKCNQEWQAFFLLH